MYTSVTDNPGEKRKLNHFEKTVFVYIAVTVFCIIFNKVYSFYSHEVTSDSMTYMFLYPLLGGTLPFALLRIFAPKANTFRHYRFNYNCYNSGIAVLTFRSCMIGIFEIAGTYSSFITFYTVAGLVFTVVALSGFLINLRNT